ncbi:CAP domain-containing protein [Lujinxingia vulgaris]|uniref:CAP domain-containing protein n=1 Tax=Lujinxingia vulgaris TaxID=2600176 RepID=A0A5C6X9H3_9DELT|nr:CAP domain-containing protein [Lujinxingia vulgaris]TXD38026.1 CAP domain-containing protein [Lujinxingia vulgaris]
MTSRRTSKDFARLPGVTFLIILFLLMVGAGCVPPAEGVDPLSEPTDNWEFEDLDRPPLDARIAQVVEATNRARARAQDCGVHGPMEAVGPVEADEALEMAATAHAHDLAAMGALSHTGSDGSDFVERAERAGFEGQPVGENIAATFRLGEALVRGWIDSDDHCRVLMNPDARFIGVGLFDAEPGARFSTYWVQVFGY